MGAQGTATIDFGSGLTSEASIAVTGQGSILGTSLVEAWIMEASTADNGTIAHKALAFLAHIYCNTVSAGVGFTITVMLIDGFASRTFKIQWVWN